MSPALERVMEQRYASALADVTHLKEEHPQDRADELANRLIRRYAKDMALGGAVAGGAAAAPVAGVAVAAASAGIESAYSVGRLGEMIVAIGLLYGQAPTSANERRAVVLAVMGMADGAATGMSGLAARAGARGGAKVLRRIPAAGSSAGGIGRKAVNRLATGKGPWSAAALVPYGIGAGVGAAGSALLARAIGRAAKEYFAASSRNAAATTWPEEDPADGEIVDAESAEVQFADGQVVVEVEIVDAEIVDSSRSVDPPDHG